MWVPIAALCLVVLCCKHSMQTPTAFDSLATASASASESASATLDPTSWPLSDLRMLQRHGSVARPSTGHGARYDIEISSSDPAQFTSGVSASVGFVVCATHVMRGVSREGAPVEGPITCMKKESRGYSARDDDWRFGVAKPGATVWMREGQLDDCAECHRAAPNDHRFGP